MLHILPTKSSLKAWMKLKAERFNEAFTLDLFRYSEDVLQIYRDLKEVASYINTHFHEFVETNMRGLGESISTITSSYIRTRLDFENYVPNNPNFTNFVEDESEINNVISLINNNYLTIHSLDLYSKTPDPFQLDFLAFLFERIFSNIGFLAFLFERIFSNIDFFKPFNVRPLYFIEIFTFSSHVDKNFNVSINPILVYENYVRESNINASLDEKPKIKVFAPCTCGGKFIQVEDTSKSAICVLCEKRICTKCGAQKTLNSPHSCDEEERLNFKTIKRNSKACPNCGVRIQRSEGCSQMFCTICHIGFDYNSGEIIKSNFHNPHRAEWLDQTGGVISLNNDICQDFSPHRFRNLTVGHRGIIINLAMFANCFKSRNRDEEYKVRFIKKRLHHEVSRNSNVGERGLENHKFHEDIARSLKLYETSRIAFIELEDFITSFAVIAKSICNSISSYSNSQIVENSILAFKLLLTFFEKIELEFIPFFTYKSIYLDTLQIHISYQYIKHMVQCFSLSTLDSYLGLSTAEKSTLVEEISPIVKKLDSVIRPSAKTFSSFYSEISQN